MYDLLIIGGYVGEVPAKVPTQPQEGAHCMLRPV